MSLKSEINARIAEEARLVILDQLAGQTDGRLGDLLLQRALDAYGFRRDRDWVKTQLVKLEALGAVTLTEVDTMVIARIERAGRDHLDGRAVIAGITRPHEVE